jgi:hypothetical protein
MLVMYEATLLYGDACVHCTLLSAINPVVAHQRLPWLATT